jgi:hypothetical protein
MARGVRLQPIQVASRHLFIKEGELYVLALYVNGNIIVGPAGSFIVGFKIAFGERFNV